MPTTTRELTAIGETIQLYFDGMHHGDTARLRQAFHPQAFLFGYFNGKFCHDSLDAWMKEVADTPKPIDNDEAYDMRIVSTDVSGQVAIVKVAVLYLGLRFTDYLTLSQLDGRWQIVNKAYVHD
ncbi:nuclear transport factor 2 family protein [Pseudomonas sp. LS44]|uniref:nuclear transport factor 2 family protein n=1 Tax=Pseudomonas sp. LS44 TaxID=1357074 RepID=UPI00215A31B3|nr:nuclear transport factor 2 family protein [Pseudomonas sp. LS44]UVE17158.1 nuclear transport factor 2 family protein [Pseudomonas sp. LS44]